MTEPYFDDGTVTLYLGDCRHIPEWLAADVLVTDPPYGRNWRQGDLGILHGWADDSHPGIEGDRDTGTRDTALELWGDRPALVFGHLQAAPPARTKQVLVYLKPSNAGMRGAMGGRRRDLEAVYMVGPWPSGIGGRTSLLTTRETTSGSPASVAGRFGHPHAKPGDLMSELVGMTTGIIADPFAGSGSTLVAAKRLGRKAIGVELAEEYAETAARRLSQGVLAWEGS